MGGSGCGRFCRHTEPAGVACETEFVRLRNAYHSQFRYVYPFDVDAPEEYDDSHYEQLDDRCWLLVEDYAVDFCGTTRDWRSWLF